MNGESQQARRYHWYSEGLKDFVDEPHSAIEGLGQGEIINVTHCRAAASRSAQLDLLSDLGPDGITKKISALTNRGETKPASAQPSLPTSLYRQHHDVRASDMVMRRLRGNLAASASCAC